VLVKLNQQLPNCVWRLELLGSFSGVCNEGSTRADSFSSEFAQFELWAPFPWARGQHIID
jgi:hypothetical protein